MRSFLILVGSVSLAAAHGIIDNFVIDGTTYGSIKCRNLRFQFPNFKTVILLTTLVWMGSSQALSASLGDTKRMRLLKAPVQSMMYHPLTLLADIFLWFLLLLMP